MKKIQTVIGARPQFIKSGAISRCLQDRADFEEEIIHTGQHFDPLMSDVFFEELGIQKPKYNININGGSHGDMTGRMMIELEKVMVQSQPDIVLVYGDTNSTLAAALVASKLNIKIAHVEAGLRSFNMGMPEEVNRVVTDRISDFLFVPSEKAKLNLEREGFRTEQILNSGDVMYDMSLHYRNIANKFGRFISEQSLIEQPYVLVTVHRAENTNSFERLNNIVNAVEALSKQIKVKWPIHPRTRKSIEEFGLLAGREENLGLVEPLGYFDMVQAESSATLILTDSGGVQKEAFFYSVPCVTLRDETEWSELIDSGWNVLCPPTSSEQIVSTVISRIGCRGAESRFYGDGTAAVKILDFLDNYYK